MDEPCSALDPIATSKVEDLIHQLKKNYTIVVVTHNIPSARAIGDRFAVLDQGRMFASGTIETLDASEEPLVQAFMRAQGGG